MGGKETRSERVASLTAGLVAWALAIICTIPLIGAGYLTYSHVVEWLKFGTYPTYTTTELFSDLGLVYPSSNWVGIQHIIDWAMSEPAAGFLVVTSLLLGFTLERFAESIHEF